MLYLRSNASFCEEIAQKPQNHFSYHPQANGTIERMNHTFAEMLSSYTSSDQRDWERTLQ